MLTRRQLAISFVSASIGLGGVWGRRSQGATSCRQSRKRRGRIEHARIGPSQVFPQLNSWLDVVPGMTETEVRGILGEPLTSETPMAGIDPDVVRLYRWSYGRLPIDSPLVPAEFQFNLYFHEGRVREIEEPFERNSLALPRWPAPSVPRPISPESGHVLRHYPRIVDFRWLPSVGEYPVSYQIEVAMEEPSLLDGAPTEHDDKKYFGDRRYVVVSSCADVPYFCTELPGKQHYAWRVKAVNQHGESDWSSTTIFRADV